MNPFECPRCHRDGFICIRILKWSHVDDDGSDPDWRRCPDHDHEWGDESEAACVACDWRGPMKELIER
jgi:hypothetical protein